MFGIRHGFSITFSKIFYHGVHRGVLYWVPFDKYERMVLNIIYNEENIINKKEKTPGKRR